MKEMVLEDVEEKLVDDLIASSEGLIFDGLLGWVRALALWVEHTLVYLLIVIWEFNVRVILDLFSQVLAGLILLLLQLEVFTYCHFFEQGFEELTHGDMCGDLFFEVEVDGECFYEPQVTVKGKAFYALITDTSGKLSHHLLVFLKALFFAESQKVDLVDAVTLLLKVVLLSYLRTAVSVE